MRRPLKKHACPLCALFLHLLDEEDPAKDSEVLGLQSHKTERSWIPESQLAEQPLVLLEHRLDFV